MDNWINVEPPIYRKGRLVERQSEDCMLIRWAQLDPTIAGNYICDSCENITIYRWVNLDPLFDYYCSGTTKMYKQQQQQSTDSGTTWENVTPPVYRVGDAYEYNSTDCGWQDYDTLYLTFIAQDNGTFTFSGNTGSSLSYSLDNGSTWSAPSSSFTTSTIQSGNKVLWKGTNSSNIGTFSSTGRFVAEGNSMSLIYGDDFSGQTSISTQSAFARMFEGCTGLTSAENMVLPATTLQRACYYGMFSGCTALTTAMTVLPGYSPKQSCYAYMFAGCTSLTRAPELPGNLSQSSGGKSAYNGMFSGCTSLNYIKCLTTNVPSDDYGYPSCTANWVYGVAATGTFVKNASTTWPTGTKWVNGSIPDGWTVIDAT